MLPWLPRFSLQYERSYNYYEIKNKITIGVDDCNDQQIEEKYWTSSRHKNWNSNFHRILDLTKTNKMRVRFEQVDVCEEMKYTNMRYANSELN